VKGIESYDEHGYWSYLNGNFYVCTIDEGELLFESQGDSLTAVEVVDKLAALESQLAATKARLAEYEVGFDPAVKPPKDGREVFIRVNDCREYYAIYDCPSDDSIARFIVLPFGDFTPVFSINDIIRWFPLPGSKGGECE